MSVKNRMDKYWNHDNRIGMRILRELGGIRFVLKNSDWEDHVKRHRLHGSMCRHHKRLIRLNRRGHIAPIVKRLAEGILL